MAICRFVHMVELGIDNVTLVLYNKCIESYIAGGIK